MDLLVQDVEGTAHEVTLPFAVLAQVFDRIAARSELALSVTTDAGGRQLVLPVAAWRLVPTVRDGQAQLTCRVPDGSGVDLAFTWNPVTGVRRLGLSVDV
ncbi:hypothetical protein [Methylobacterium nodulans]|uniref:hypothetical protein n=1 Tax=Methylobacterium nodulans TaxID=114616 RepID=UPI0012ECF71F|nr:hypothetical protein [Methylobacterium nodulans]